MIKLERVSKAYNDQPVLNRVSLTVEQGEVVGLMGASGAGKTTILRIIAGLTQPDSGRVTVASSRLGYVFQEARLLPWRCATENVAVALRAAGADRSAARTLAREWLDRVRLAPFEDYYPAQLSGGMQQRVALARAFAVQPNILLLDEPFSSLDEANKHDLANVLRQLIRETGVTVVFVTHALPDALELADRVLCLYPRAGLEPLRVAMTSMQPAGERAPAAAL